MRSLLVYQTDKRAGRCP